MAMAMVEWFSTRVNFLAWAALLCELTAEYKPQKKEAEGLFKTTRNFSAQNQWSRSWKAEDFSPPVMNIEGKKSKSKKSKSCEHLFNLF